MDQRKEIISPVHIPSQASTKMTAHDFFERGNAHSNEGNADSALADYTEAIRLDPYCAQAYYYRGMVHFESGDTDAALADYTEAIRLNPTYANAYYNRTYVRAAKQDFRGAVRDALKFLKIAPKDRDVSEIQARLKEWRQRS